MQAKNLHKWLLTGTGNYICICHEYHNIYIKVQDVNFVSALDYVYVTDCQNLPHMHTMAKNVFHC